MRAFSFPTPSPPNAALNLKINEQELMFPRQNKALRTLLLNRYLFVFSYLSGATVPPLQNGPASLCVWLCVSVRVCACACVRVCVCM